MHMLFSLPYFYYKYTKKFKVIHKGYNKYVSILLKRYFFFKMKIFIYFVASLNKVKASVIFYSDVFNKNIYVNIL